MRRDGDAIVMFGLFKQKITPEELGRTATRWANEFLVSDAGVSLGLFFDDFWDRDTSLTPEQYLGLHAIPASKTTLYPPVRPLRRSSCVHSIQSRYRASNNTGRDDGFYKNARRL